MELEQNEVVVSNIEYERPPMWRRMMAIFIDLLLFVFFAFGFFLGTREVVVNTPHYQETMQSIETMMKLSKLYIEDHGTYISVISYIDNQSSWDAQKKMNYLITAIEGKEDKSTSDNWGFIDYIGFEAGDKIQKQLIDKYDSTRLDAESFSDGKGHPYFIKDTSGNIVINLDENGSPYVSYLTYLEDYYEPFMKEVCVGYLNQYVSEYNRCMNIISNYVIFLEFPVGIALAGLIVYVVPPLIFRRGKKTIGMLSYKIGRVDNRLLNVKIGRFFARSAIFYFGVLLLSFVTLGAPMFITVTMMIFTKNHQSFPDYMLGIQEVSTDKTKVYYSLQEAEIDQLNIVNKPIDFEAKSRL